jgi:nitrous oxidase accessory protein NosD
MNYTGSGWSASGILLYYPDPGMILSNNNVHDCQGALNAYFADGMLLDSCLFNLNGFEYIWGGDSVVVTNNTFTGNGEALYIADAINLKADENSFDGNATAVVIDGLADNVAMSGNDIINSTSAGVAVQPYGPDEPLNISITGNNISGNAFGLGNTTTNMVDATANWWGDATGPDTGTVVLSEDNRDYTMMSTNPRRLEIQKTVSDKNKKVIETIALVGDGDKISTMVDYSPWWGANYVGDLHSSPWQWYLDNSNASTIQEGVDMASDYDSVHVTAGLYSESVSLIKPLALLGDSGAVNDVGDPNLTAIDIASSDVIVDNLTLSNCRQGILVWLEPAEYSVSPGYTNIRLTNNTILNTNGNRGFGIYVGTESERFNPADPLGIYDPSLTDLLDFSGLYVFNNTIYNTSQAGLVLQSLKTVSDTVKVKFNDISYTPYSGIWIDAGQNLLVNNNALHSCGYGVFLSDYADGYYEGSPDDPYDPKDIFFGYNQIFNNNSGFAAYDCWPSYLTFYHNRMMGHTDFAIYNYFSYDIDATYNYWGSDRGPSHPGNPYGDGDTVTNYVLYDPWCNYDFTICGDQAGNCEYVLGDVNGDNGYNGLDIVYGVTYLKGGPPPTYECECTPENTWYVSGDVNASCNYNGLDITYGVAFFKGGPIPQPCPDCEPVVLMTRDLEQPKDEILIGTKKINDNLPELK